MTKRTLKSMSEIKRRAVLCVKHHQACDCREATRKMTELELRARIKALEGQLKPFKAAIALPYCGCAACEGIRGTRLSPSASP